MCLNLSDHQLKVDCYEHSLVYMKHVVTPDQKSTRDAKIKRKESKHNTTDSHQHIREQENKKGAENFKDNQEKIKWQ